MRDEVLSKCSPVAPAGPRVVGKARVVSSSPRVRSVSLCPGPQALKKGCSLFADSSLVLKELLTTWNTGNELEAILEFAPRYLDYFSSSKKPSAIAKIFG
jgi:hypothetical protein